MIIRTATEEMECHPGDIVWLPEGVTLDYDTKGRRCTYFYALFPIDWAKKNNMEEP
jgi:ethanolamine utilization protein EutQ (cupin superfamily)